ncbi:energy transducer TonB [Nostoc ellipsosporum NOK]|nr:energy transducer TonB [Nostoc ellipsosporum NOK]
MKINSLKWASLLMAGSFLFVACNNEDKKDSAANTPPANEYNVGDSTGSMSNNPADPSKTNSTPGSKVDQPRKTGKASGRMADEDMKVKIEKDKSGIYTRAELSPAYPGGQDGLDAYITRNIEYPADAIDNNIEGTVYVQFAVDENGKVSQVHTAGTKLGYGLEEEAVKVVSKMPAWTPGQVGGKKVKVWRTLPIVYRLES